MPFRLEKAKTGSTPCIIVDEEKGYMKFEGESFHENVVSFFSDINNWLKEYLKTDFTTFVFDCELAYFNSSTAKLLLNMLMEMDESASGGRSVTVNWITEPDNDIIIECGEDFKDEIRHMCFNIVLKHI